MSVPEIRTVLLCCLPSSMASKGLANRSLNDVVKDGVVNNRIVELSDEFKDVAAGSRALNRMAASKIEVATDSRKEGCNSGAGQEFSTF